MHPKGTSFGTPTVVVIARLDLDKFAYFWTDTETLFGTGMVETDNHVSNRTRIPASPT